MKYNDGRSTQWDAKGHVRRVQEALFHSERERLMRLQSVQQSGLTDVALDNLGYADNSGLMLECPVGRSVAQVVTLSQ